ncbi:MAG: RNase adapter RapZ [Clostridiaceae bacterium]|nr:RNase adapter RapZ [Clostridiaceae bacterium]
MRFIIVTGMSGAGKSEAVNLLEDIGYYCIDNMPPAFLLNFAELCYNSFGKFDKVAIVCDIRGGEMFEHLAESLSELKHKGYNYELLFLDAKDETLIKRYKESRRKHPLSEDDRLPESIAKERAKMNAFKDIATHIIDTSFTSRKEFQDKLASLFSDSLENKGIIINVISFGFKHGIPMDSDLIFDVRFLPNPFYIPELKQKSGLEREVSEYVMSFSQSQDFQNKLFDMIDFLIPHYIEEGKSQIVIAIGCTGGKHRSVTFAHRLGEHLKDSNYRVFTTHRDYDKSS